MELQLWREILIPYELAIEELVVKFMHITKEFRGLGLYSPIEGVQGRVKTISSILEKAQRKNIPFEQITEQMDDIAGIRIMCQFVEDIEKVVEIIRSRTDMSIRSEQDYIKNLKKSGYRSYHITVHYKVQTIHGLENIQVEIQIRTLAMNFWAIIEHSLQYKYSGVVPEQIRERLHASANAVYSLDREMSSIRDEAMEAQHVFRQKANVVEDIVKNLENLNKVLPLEELMIIQQNFYHIYQDEDMDMLLQFNRDLDILLQKYHY